MDFFIPAAKDSEQADRVYHSIKAFLIEQDFSPLSDDRIYRLDSYHNGKNYKYRIGDRDQEIREPIIAILYHPARELYLVCTTNRGVARGMPILVGKSEVRGIELFD